MLSTCVRSLVAMACLSVCSTLLAVEAKDLAGSYTVKGVEPNGDKYEGTCEITHTARHSVQLVWKFGKKRSIGQGKLENDVLTVEYEGAIADREGKAVYDVKSKDRLVGEWKRKGTKGTGKETLARDK